MTVSTIPFALIVDDDPIMLMNLEAILEDAGFRCHAEDHLREKLPDGKKPEPLKKAV